MDVRNSKVNVANKGKLRAVTVCTHYHQNLYCYFKVLSIEGYLFTLIPSDSPFTDFELSAIDKYINQDIDFGILERVKSAIIDYFL